jgi:hypothetical protein
LDVFNSAADVEINESDEDVHEMQEVIKIGINLDKDRFCGLVVRVLGYKSGGPG